MNSEDIVQYYHIDEHLGVGLQDVCYFCIFLGTSAAQAVAADDMILQCPTRVSESVFQSIPTAMQQLIEERAVTSGRGQGKISGKRIILC